MRLRKAIKRIAALGVGAAFVGSTMMGAMAADLANYPAPFISNGVFSGVLVVGDKAAAEDVIGVSDIATSLQFAATKSAGATTTSSTVEGDSFLVKNSGDSLNLLQNLSGVKQILNADDLAALGDGSITNEKGTYTYKQYLELGTSSGQGITMVEYTTNDVSDDPAFYLRVLEDPTSSTTFADGTAAYNYKLDFPTSLKSDRDSNNDLDDLDNKKITMLGKEYSIVNTEIIDTHELTIDLMGGAWSGTMEEGEEKTIKLGDTEYTVRVDIITDTGTRSTKLTINGETTEELGEPSGTAYPWSYKLADGTEIGIRSILPNEAGDVTQDMVEFYLGAQKLTLYDPDITSDITSDGGGTIYESGDSITDLALSITGGNSSSDTIISSIQIMWEPSEDYYVPVGGKLSEQLAANDEGSNLFTKNIDFFFAGVNIADQDDIKLSYSGSSKFKLTATNKDGDATVIDLAYLGSSNQVRLGKAADKAMFIEEIQRDIEPLARAPNVTKGEYFLIEKNKFSHLMQVVKFDTSANELQLKDIGSGKTTKHSYTDSVDSNVTFYKNGNSFIVTVGPGASTVGTEDHLLLEDITDGQPTEAAQDVVSGNSLLSGGNNATFYTQHEGILAFTNGSTVGAVVDENEVVVQLFEDEDGQEDETGESDFVQFTVYHDGTNINLRAPNSSDEKFSLMTWDSDSNRQTEYTEWGTFVDFDTSGDQNSVKVVYPGKEVTADVYITSGGVVTSSVSESAESVTINKIEVGATKLASEVADVEAQNAILVGGPCANPKTADALGNPVDCLEGYEAGKGVIQLVEFTGGKVAMIVAGYTAADTRAATTIVANYKDYADSLKGAKVEVTTATSEVKEVTAAAATTE